MKKAIIAVGAFAIALGLLVFAVAFLVWQLAPEQLLDPAAASSRARNLAAASSPEAAEPHPSCLYGRVSTHDDGTYEGRLRWGGGEEAFWGDYFNGARDGNPWIAHAPPEQLPTERRKIRFLGIELGRQERKLDLDRPFMARFGDIVRIESHDRVVRVTLKSGTVFDLDGHAAGDFDDGVRVWDVTRGAVDLASRQIRIIEFLASSRPVGDANRLHGKVRTRQGEFTGFIQWNREEGLGRDELDGQTTEGEVSLRFDTIGSIVRGASDSALVTMLDGKQIVLAGNREVGSGNRGMYVDDRRYGRVLISWDAFERVDFDTGDSAPAYDDFPPGHPLAGSVTTHAGRRLAGRLVYDLDESETTETLDAPSGGVDYTILFGLIASIVAPGRDGHGSRSAIVTLHDGEELQLEAAGDLGENNAGVLIFVDGRERAEYVPWAEVEQVQFDPPPAMYPPLGGSS